MVRNDANPIVNAKGITSSLRRSANTMSSSVATADTAVSSLAVDGETIKETLDEHKYGLKVELQETKVRLDKIKSTDEREKRLIWGSVSFFTAVVVYIICKRLRIIALIMMIYSGAHKGGNLFKQLYSNNNNATTTNANAVDGGRQTGLGLSGLNTKLEAEVQSPDEQRKRALADDVTRKEAWEAEKLLNEQRAKEKKERERLRQQQHQEKEERDREGRENDLQGQYKDQQKEKEERENDLRAQQEQEQAKEIEKEHTIEVIHEEEQKEGGREAVEVKVSSDGLASSDGSDGGEGKEDLFSSMLDLEKELSDFKASL